MKKSLISVLALGLPLALVVGCETTPEDDDPDMSDLPDWVTQPHAEDGLAATACVATAGSFSRDQSRADLQARQQLAAQMGTQIESMAEQYERTIETDDEISTGAHFEEVTRGVVEQELQGSNRIKGDYVTMPGGDQEFCSMMAVGQSSVNAILEEVASAAGADEDAFTQDEMREQFMSQEALNRMDEQLGN
ncbi:hypothetical protein LRD18_00410 [Halorhodospira halochloris]|uniref:hypothetical protein n=1 Tax=Halorhodospira halochloris TaxID=1052 RepID=UPI001EE8DC6C|nr:hypothetical protein [Halorhodospira halochloris]MCG5529334.1 hypothetical protein [Halorhodospira halochloris]